MHFRRSKMSSARRFGRAPLIFTCAFLHHGRAISKYVHARAKHAHTLFTNVHTSPSFHLLHHKCLHSSHKRQGSALWTFVSCTCNSILFLLQLAYHVDARKGRRNLLKFYIHNREYYLFMLEIKPSHAHTPHFLSILDASSIARMQCCVCSLSVLSCLLSKNRWTSEVNPTISVLKREVQRRKPSRSAHPARGKLCHPSSEKWVGYRLNRRETVVVGNQVEFVMLGHWVELSWCNQQYQPFSYSLAAFTGPCESVAGVLRGTHKAFSVVDYVGLCF